MNAEKLPINGWNEIPQHFSHVTLDEYIIMPNHEHGIINITTPVGANNYSPLQTYGTSKTIGSIVRGFKIGVTKWIHQNMNNKKTWQRSFHDHIICDEHTLNKIRQYIINNPEQWQHDRNNPGNINTTTICESRIPYGNEIWMI